MGEPVTLEESKEIHLPEHEILLSFNNDSGAEAFYAWWGSSGEDAFNQWVEKNSE